MADVTSKHKFTSGISDGADATLIRPSNWNAAHDYSGGSDNDYLIRDSGGTNGASWLTKLDKTVRVGTQFDKTNSSALGDVTNLSVALLTGHTYKFQAVLFVDANATGGHKYAIQYSSTVSAIIYQINSVNNTTKLNVINARETALAGAAGEASGTTTAYTVIEGTLVATGSGNLTVQFAQNTATPATTSSVLVGSSLTVEDIL